MYSTNVTATGLPLEIEAAILAQLTSGFRPLLVQIVIQVALSAILIPLMGFLLWYRTSELNRSGMYYLNLVAIGLGIALGTLTTYLDMTSMLHPLAPTNGHLLLAVSIIAVMIPIFIQCILFWRLALIYCPRWTSHRIIPFIWIPPAAFIIVRIVNIAITMRLISNDVLQKGGPVQNTGVDAWTYKGTRLELFLQIADNSYISILFLCKIQSAHKGATHRGHRNYAWRLKMLFWSAATNFVFPVMINAAELLFIYTSSDYHVALYLSSLFFVNDIVQIVCSVLATLWVAMYRWWEATDLDSNQPMSVGRGTIRTGPNIGLHTGSELHTSDFMPHSQIHSYWSADSRYTRFPDLRGTPRSSHV